MPYKFSVLPQTYQIEPNPFGDGGTGGALTGTAQLLNVLLPTRTNQNVTGKTTSRKILSDEAKNKLIYDVLSSDQGLAALASGENASGGFGGSTKSLMAQDLTTKIVGELANITATTEQDVNTSTSGSSKRTVICTELLRQGLLDEKLYDAGHAHFLRLPKETISGYHYLAEPVVPFLASHPNFAKFISPVATKRYEYVVHRKFSITGWITVWVGQPVCFLIGKLRALSNKEVQYG